MDNYVRFSSPVEKIVENVWKNCGKVGEKLGRFTQVFYEVKCSGWKNLKMYTIFVISCGKISTGVVNKIFNFYRYGGEYFGRFTHFPHSLLL